MKLYIDEAEDRREGLIIHIEAETWIDRLMLDQFNEKCRRNGFGDKPVYVFEEGKIQLKSMLPDTIAPHEGVCECYRPTFKGMVKNATWVVLCDDCNKFVGTNRILPAILEAGEGK